MGTGSFPLPHVNLLQNQLRVSSGMRFACDFLSKEPRAKRPVLAYAWFRDSIGYRHVRSYQSAPKP